MVHIKLTIFFLLFISITYFYRFPPFLFTEIQQSLNEERESKQTIQNTLERLRSECSTHRTQAKERAEEAASYQTTSESLRQQIVELQNDRSEHAKKMEEQRKTHRTNIDELRTQFSTERKQIEKSYDDRITLERTEREERTALERKRMLEANKDKEMKHTSKINELTKEIEDRKDRQMQNERVALRNELSVIQTHMEQKVTALEDCVRGLTSEGEKYQTRILEQTRDIERQRGKRRDFLCF